MKTVPCMIMQKRRLKEMVSVLIETYGKTGSTIRTPDWLRSVYSGSTGMFDFQKINLHIKPIWNSYYIRWKKSPLAVIIFI
jgi:hypothetical protein